MLLKTKAEQAEQAENRLNTALHFDFSRFLANLRQHWMLGVVLAVYFFFSLQYALSVPAWEAPDEPAHFAYIHHIRTTGGPPIQSFEEGRNQVETGHHPPLYYYLGALLTLPYDLSDFSQIRTNPYFSFANNDGGVNRFEQSEAAQRYPNTLAAVQIVRYASILFGAGTLLFIYLSGLLILSGVSWGWAQGGRFPAALAAALTGWLPQFAFLSGAVNNDNAVVFFCALGFWLCLKLALASSTSRISWRFLGLIGLIVGLGLLSKYNALVLIPLVGLALGIAAWARRDWWLFWRGGLISGGVCVVVIGWWFGRNQLLYGDPAGWSMWRSSYSSIEQGSKVHLDGQFLQHAWSRWFNSYYGYFGWFNLPFEAEVYKWLARFAAVLVGALIFWLLTLLVAGLTRQRWSQLTPFAPDRTLTIGLLFTGLLILMVFGIALNYAMTFGDAGTQGRYLYAGLPGFSLLFAGGLTWLLSRLRLPVLRLLGSGLLGLGLLTGSLWLNQHALNDIIRPTYLPLPELRQQVILKELPPQAVRPASPQVFAPGMQLEGYQFSVSRANLKAGEISLTLYWRATTAIKENWVGFAHLINGQTTFAQQNGTPAQGRYQTFRWQPGELLKDERKLQIANWQVQQMKQYNLPLVIYLGWLRASDGGRSRLADGAEGLTLVWK